MSPGESQRRVGGILCTYRRPDDVQVFIERLEGQTRPPDVVVVVDNGSDPAVREFVTSRAASSVDWRYVDPGSNIGPAGAFDLGFRRLMDVLTPEDLIVHFDDDDPPVADDQLEILTGAIGDALKTDEKVGGIGMSGGRLNTCTGLVNSVTGSERLEDVDHLHGGYLPVYLARALLEVGGNDPTFFYGFEELELGRRLHLNGWRLIVHNELMARVRDGYPKRGGLATGRLSVNEDDIGWSRFHKERNLIRILRRERRWGALLVTIFGRQVVKPVVALPRQPRAGWQRLRLGLRATLAGLAGGGGIDSRYPPP